MSDVKDPEAPPRRKVTYLNVVLADGFAKRDVPALVETIEKMGGVKEVGVATGARLMRRLEHLENANERLRRRVAELEALTDQVQSTATPAKGVMTAEELNAMNKPHLIDLVMKLQRKVQALNKRAVKAEQSAGGRKRR